MLISETASDDPPAPEIGAAVVRLLRLVERARTEPDGELATLLAVTGEGEALLQRQQSFTTGQDPAASVARS